MHVWSYVIYFYLILNLVFKPFVCVWGGRLKVVYLYRNIQCISLLVLLDYTNIAVLAYCYYNNICMYCNLILTSSLSYCQIVQWGFRPNNLASV